MTGVSLDAAVLTVGTHLGDILGLKECTPKKFRPALSCVRSTLRRRLTLRIRIILDKLGASRVAFQSDRLTSKVLISPLAK